MTNNSATSSLTILRCFGRVFVRTGKELKTGEDRFYEITGCHPLLTDGHIDQNDGLLPDARQVPVHDIVDLVVALNESTKSRRKASSKTSRRRHVLQEASLR